MKIDPSTLTLLGLAYAAGFIDADGHIGIQCAAHNDRHAARHIPVMHAGGVDRGPLDMLQAMFGGTVHLRKPGPKAWLPFYLWRITGTRAIEAARHLRPYLRIKHEQADLLLRFEAEAIWVRERTGEAVPPTEFQRRDQLAQAMKFFNQREYLPRVSGRAQ